MAVVLEFVELKVGGDYWDPRMSKFGGRET
jgi:hypothetical protein